MSEYSESHAPPAGGPTAEPSTTDVAREQAAQVSEHARQAGGQVVQTATDQARQVAAETSRQARDLLGETQEHARYQASAQQKKAAVQLHSVADEIGQMASSSSQSGVATEFARQAAGRLHGAASWLEQREPADLLDEVRSFARRRPGTFLIGAAVLGLAAGRLTRGLAASRNEQPATGDGPVTDDPAATTARPGNAAYPDPAAIPEAAYAGMPAYPEPAYQTEPTYQGKLGHAAGSELGDPAVPAYPAKPAYPAQSSYPADALEPRTSPRYEGPR